MTVSEKIKTIDNKSQYNLDRQTAKTSALPQENVEKYEVLTGESVLPEKRLIEKAPTVKIFEYSPLGSKLKNQNSIAENQYQELGKICGHDKRVVTKKGGSSNLSYNNFNFIKFNISDEEFDEISEDTIYKRLNKFFVMINEFKKVKHRKDEKKEEKTILEK